MKYQVTRPIFRETDFPVKHGERGAGLSDSACVDGATAESAKAGKQCRHRSIDALPMQHKAQGAVFRMNISDINYRKLIAKAF